MTPSAGRPVVLVVDDEKNIRKAIELALEQERIEVIGAVDAHQALRVLAERIVDLLIIDIRLGEIDGISLLGHPDLVWVKVDHFSIKA